MESNWLKLKDSVLSTGRLAIVAIALWVAAAASVPSPVCAQESDSCCTVEYSASFPKVWCVDVTITCDCDGISGSMEIDNACCGTGCLPE